MRTIYTIFCLCFMTTAAFCSTNSNFNLNPGNNEEITINNDDDVSEIATIQSRISGEIIQIRFDSQAKGKADVYIYDSEGFRLGFSAYDISEGIQKLELDMPIAKNEIKLRIIFQDKSFNHVLTR